ncbi:MAG: peptidase M15 [Flavobacteriaceae bacterium]|nr:peptidase M15 [Flavobacteriaceae bacterium]|tara:strand:- start:387 stop:857 length:471 start_codon:yes stop_codon:yes gene_type:complete
MKLSPNFSVREFTRSQTALRKGIDNSLGQEELINLVYLVAKCIQPIRDVHGPVNVNSGFRCLELNRAIGSSDSSAHVKAQAADIEANSISNYDLAKWISENLEFDQLILEYPGPDPRDGWNHIAYKNDGSNRKQILTAMREDGKTVYKEGLISEWH